MVWLPKPPDGSGVAINPTKPKTMRRVFTMRNRTIGVIVLAIFMLGLFTTSVLAYDPPEQFISSSWSGTGSGGTHIKATVQREDWNDVQLPRTGVTEYEYKNSWSGSVNGSMAGNLGDEIRDVSLNAMTTGSGYFSDMSKYSLLDVATDDKGIDIVSKHKVEIVAERYKVEDAVGIQDQNGGSNIEDDLFVHAQGFQGSGATFFSKSFSGSSSHGPAPDDGKPGAWAFALPEMGNFSGNLTFSSVDPFNVYSRLGNRGAYDVLQLGAWTNDPGERTYNVDIKAYDSPMPGQVYSGSQGWVTPEEPVYYNPLGR